MENLRAYYPSFLKQKPLIWGISLHDLLILSAVLFVLLNIGVGQVPTLFLIVIFYLAMILVRRFYPRRHFEFVLITKSSITRRDINEKLRL
jgi:hypothetical protein